MSRHRTTAAALLVLLAAWAFSGTAGAAVPRLIFPVVAKVSYVNDFGDPRPQGRHEGNDIMAAKRSPVVAVEAGRVTKWGSSSRGGCMLYLYGRSGTMYMYIHLNNDRTLKNDNRGGCRNGVSYAPGLRSSQYVRAGQLIAYVGDSGDANGLASHLHFEVHPNGGRAVSPYKHLGRAMHLLYPRPPSTLATVSLVISGSVAATHAELDPQLVQLHVNKVRIVETGWIAKPARMVTLAVPLPTDPAIPSALDALVPGDPVRAFVDNAPQSLSSARALAGVHTAVELLPR
jgi:murein DD-endopeptidase MepM/ murein hydrolase activator NlpD